MKLINSESIQESEKEFIDMINAALDWKAIGKMLMEKHNFTLQEKIKCENGDLVVFNDTIAYKFDFEIKVPLSVMVNRQGECLDISTFGRKDEEPGEDNLFQDADTIDTIDTVDTLESSDTSDTSDTSETSETSDTSDTSE
ncbi:hypothetical protein, partial [Desulfobacula sp.]|nr:hypothetical protein [Desulfobacula sp.]